MKNLSEHSDSEIFVEDVVKNQKCILYFLIRNFNWFIESN